MFVMLVRHPDAFQGIALATSLHVSSSCIGTSYFGSCRWDRVPIVCVLVFSQVRPWAMYLGLGSPPGCIIVIPYVSQRASAVHP